MYDHEKKSTLTKAKYIGANVKAIEGKTHCSFYKITPALAFPKDHNPVNTTFFLTKKTKRTKTQRRQKREKRQKSHLR